MWRKTRLRPDHNHLSVIVLLINTGFALGAPQWDFYTNAYQQSASNLPPQSYGGGNFAYQRPYFGRSNGFMPFGGNFGANTGGTGASSQTVTTSDGQFGQVTSNGGTGDEAGSSEQTPSGTGGSAGGTSDGLSGAGENAPSSGGTNPSGMVAGGPEMTNNGMMGASGGGMMSGPVPGMMGAMRGTDGIVGGMGPQGADMPSNMQGMPSMPSGMGSSSSNSMPTTMGSSGMGAGMAGMNGAMGMGSTGGMQGMGSMNAGEMNSMSQMGSMGYGMNQMAGGMGQMPMGGGGAPGNGFGGQDMSNFGGAFGGFGGTGIFPSQDLTMTEDGGMGAMTMGNGMGNGMCEGMGCPPQYGGMMGGGPTMGTGGMQSGSFPNPSSSMNMNTAGMGGMSSAGMGGMGNAGMGGMGNAGMGGINTAGMGGMSSGGMGGMNSAGMGGMNNAGMGGFNGMNGGMYGSGRMGGMGAPNTQPTSMLPGTGMYGGMGNPDPYGLDSGEDSGEDPQGGQVPIGGGMGPPANPGGTAVDQSNLRQYAQYLEMINKRYGIGMPGQNTGTMTNGGSEASGTDTQYPTSAPDTAQTPSSGLSGGAAQSGGYGSAVQGYQTQNNYLNSARGGYYGAGLYGTQTYPVTWPMTGNGYNPMTNSVMPPTPRPLTTGPGVMPQYPYTSMGGAGLESYGSMMGGGGAGTDTGYGMVPVSQTGMPGGYMTYGPDVFSGPDSMYMGGNSVTSEVVQPLQPVQPPPATAISAESKESRDNSSATSHQSTTSIQALTQQIRRLPAVLYVDSRSSDAKRTETLLRETYGLPLVSFYVDKIDKPKVVEKNLQQLTAHTGMPYLFICGTFIGSQEHIDNYHKNKQIPQLVEYVCGDEKDKQKKKEKKKGGSRSRRQPFLSRFRKKSTHS